MMVLGVVIYSFMVWLYFRFVWKWWVVGRSHILRAHEANAGS
jgi:hypothetical protein